MKTIQQQQKETSASSNGDSSANPLLSPAANTTNNNTTSRGASGEPTTPPVYRRRSTENPGYARATTFTRGITLDGSAFTQFGRTVTDTIGLTYETEEQWTQSLIAEYVRVAEKGVDGDMPLPAGFCREYRFGRMMFFSGVFGCFMGLLGAGFLNIADKVRRLSVLLVDYGDVYWDFCECRLLRCGLGWKMRNQINSIIGEVTSLRTILNT
jgi:hypothetical protein